MEDAMNKLKLIGVVLLVIWLAPHAAGAGDFDGSQPLLCASMDIIECDAGGECLRVTAENINAPQFLRIDFKKKSIRATQASKDERTTMIERMERVDGKLIIQGAEDGIEGVRDGLGWTLAIAEESGTMVLTGSGDEVAFVVFGACTPF
jgi:hypothetical protein